MHISAALTTEAAPPRVLRYVDDLSVYPQWISLVHSAVRVPEAYEPTWIVELRAKVGPFARSKRLRMVRTVYEQGEKSRVVFERREEDGRVHANWKLEVVVGSAKTAAQGVAAVDASCARTELTMHLHYDGRLFVGVIEAILRQNIDAGRRQLAALLGD